MEIENLDDIVDDILKDYRRGNIEYCAKIDPDVEDRIFYDPREAQKQRIKDMCKR